MITEDKKFELFNAVEMSTEDYEDIEVSEEEKRQLFEELRGEIKPVSEKRYTAVLILAAAAVLLTFGSQTGIGQHVQARVDSLIENIRYSLSMALGNKDSNAEGALTFDQTATIGTAEVSMKDMVAFDHRIVFNILVDLEGEIEDENFVGFRNLTMEVNGEAINTDNLITLGMVVDEEENVHSNVYSILLDKNVFQVDDLEIEIHFEDVLYYTRGEVRDVPNLIEGEAMFSKVTTLDALNKYTNIYDIQETIFQDEYEYVVEKLYTHPLLNFIEVYSDDEEVMNQDQIMHIKGTDEKGQLVFFETSYYLETEDYKRFSFTLIEELSEITTQELVDTEYLDLQLYLLDWPENATDAEELAPYGEPFRIKMK